MIRIALFFVFLATANHCQAYQWEYLGMDGVPTTTIEADSDSFRVFVGTNEGFRYLDLESGIWTEREDEGQTDRKVTLIRTRYGLPQGIILGRVNSSNNGYLEISDNLGIDCTVVHQSEGGPFVDLGGYGDELYTCSIAGASPGELLKTTDGGVSWMPIYGHGQTSMTSLPRGSPNLILVAGDNQVSMTRDDGTTWQSASEGLPEGEMITSLEEYHPGGCIISSSAVASTQDTVYFSWSDSPDQYDFQPILSPGFRSTTTFYIPYNELFGSTGLAAVTNDGRLLVSRNAGHSWEDETGNLPGQPIAVDYYWPDSSLFVCTQNHGVFRKMHVVTAVGEDIQNPAQVSLRAWPNPFNPRVNLSFEMASAGMVELKIFDVKGRAVATVYEGWLEAGPHQRSWDANRFASGVYMAQIVTGQQKQTTRLVLVR